jgi:hypothetical protein
MTTSASLEDHTRDHIKQQSGGCGKEIEEGTASSLWLCVADESSHLIYAACGKGIIHHYDVLVGLKKTDTPGKDLDSFGTAHEGLLLRHQLPIYALELPDVFCQMCLVTGQGAVRSKACLPENKEEEEAYQKADVQRVEQPGESHQFQQRLAAGKPLKRQTADLLTRRLSCVLMNS